MNIDSLILYKNGNTYIYNLEFSYLHNLNGPAIEYVDGYKEWWYQGKHIPVDNQEDFDKYIKLINFE